MPLLRWFAVALLLVSAVDCARLSAQTVDLRPTDTHGVRDIDAQVNGLDEAQVHTLVGADPTHTTTFEIADGLHEREIELYNVYPPGTADVTILQETWDLEGYTVVVWYHQVDDAWQGLQGVSYVDGVEF